MDQNSPKTEAKAAADTAAEEGRKAADAVRDTVQGAREHAAQTVSDVQDMARDAADSRVRQATGAAADEAERTAQAVDDAAGDYPEGSMAHDALSRVSGLLEDTAAGLRDTDLERVTSEVQRFARHNPVLFLAGAALAGFTAARLLRASERDADDWGYDTSASASHHTGDRHHPRHTHASAPSDIAPAPKGETVPREEREHQVAPVGPAVGGRHA